MNFFGHVVVSAWYSSDPAIALGAMMPDLANMCGGRMVEALDPHLAEGVALHHTTDAAFHTLGRFNQLERDTTRDLQDLGVGRGPAMGTAHVAVELLLDGALLDDQDALDLYGAAVACEQACQPARSMRWRQPEEADRWVTLRARLSVPRVLEGYRDPAVVTERIGMILARYKTLAMSADELALVGGYMPGLRDRVVIAAADIMTDLREAMP